MLSSSEILIAVFFIVVLLVMSVIDVAFSAINKLSVRRLVDNPRAKAAPSLAALLEIRPEVLMSIHVVIQLLLVSGAVLCLECSNAGRFHTLGEHWAQSS